jgi:hypothetical protein
MTPCLSFVRCLDSIYNAIREANQDTSVQVDVMSKMGINCELANPIIANVAVIGCYGDIMFSWSCDVWTL